MVRFYGVIMRTITLVRLEKLERKYPKRVTATGWSCFSRLLRQFRGVYVPWPEARSCHGKGCSLLVTAIYISLPRTRINFSSKLKFHETWSFLRLIRHNTCFIQKLLPQVRAHFVIQAVVYRVICKSGDTSWFFVKK